MAHNLVCGVVVRTLYWTYVAAGMAVSPVSRSPVKGCCTLTTLLTVTLSPESGTHAADTSYRPAALYRCFQLKYTMLHRGRT